MQILLINGPNLNMLGKREPGIYGAASLEDIENDCREHAQTLGAKLDCFQSNAEHLLIDKIHSGYGKIDGIIINPAAFTHTSIAIRDALLSVNTPFIEVHLSNVHKREAFRQHSYFSDIAVGTIVGLGAKGYLHAIDTLINHLHSNKNKQTPHK